MKIVVQGALILGAIGDVNVVVEGNDGQPAEQVAQHYKDVVKELKKEDK